MAAELIKPSVPLIPGYTKLPPLDQVEGRFIVPPILVFRVDSEDAQETIIQDLQDGLANTIEEMPFIAAEVVPENRERGTIQLEIGEDAGVWFHVREIPEIDFDELERRQFAPATFALLQLMPEPRQHDWDRSPVLTIQATFITGGLLVVTITLTRSYHTGLFTSCRYLILTIPSWMVEACQYSERHGPKMSEPCPKVVSFRKPSRLKA